jgi:hypothetical protein
VQGGGPGLTVSFFKILEIRKRGNFLARQFTLEITFYGSTVSIISVILEAQIVYFFFFPTSQVI